MKYSVCVMFFLVFVSYADDSPSDSLSDSVPTTYFIENFEEIDTIIFCATDLRSLNKNNDKAISNFIEKYKDRETHLVNEYGHMPLKKGCYHLFFWKNINSNEYGFVVADYKSKDIWHARLNGQKDWSRIHLYEKEIFKWFTAGRSIGVTLKNDGLDALTYIFTGDVDY